MDRLVSMKVFVAVAERGSFAAAAMTVGITATMVANHVKALEKHLGTRLLSRTTRSNDLTDAGRQYYAYCVEILASVALADDAVRQSSGSPSGTLRVSAPVSFGTEVLVPLLPGYLAAYPDVQVDLNLNDRVVHLEKDNFDIAVRIGALMASPDVLWKPLRAWRRILCAAPAYLRNRPAPASIRELADHDCLCYAYALSTETTWRFATPDGMIAVEVKPRLSINNGHALRRAALAGLGVIYQPDNLVLDDIAAGRLVPLLTSLGESVSPMHIYIRANHPMTPKVTTFTRYLLTHLGPDPEAA